MIKGINRQIIELVDTNNIYYEKAYLVLRPRYRNESPSVLENQAKALISGLSAPSSLCRGRRIAALLLRFFSSALVGGIISYLIFNTF